MSSVPPLTQATVTALFWTLWIQVQLSVLRFVTLLIYLGMHAILAQAIALIGVVPKDWGKGKQLLEGMFFLGFGLAYLVQIVEMVAIFIPRLHILQARLLGEHNSA